jgi:serine/threonine protein kinase
MAPEQVEGREADTRSDLFSFGAIVYEMATGKRAFDGKSTASVIAAILEREPPAMSSLQPLTPPALDHVVKKCLAKDPEKRWQSASDLTDELKWIAEAGPQPRNEALIAPHRRRREPLAWLLLGSAAFFVAILAVPAALYFRGATSAPLITRFDVVTPPTRSPSSFALSADGWQLAFVANGEGGSQLWIRPLDQVNARPLAGTGVQNGNPDQKEPWWSCCAHSTGRDTPLGTPNHRGTQ